MVLLVYYYGQLISWIDSMWRKSAKLVFSEQRWKHCIRLSIKQSYHRDDLAKPASNLYLHNLTGILETAIRATNAQFDDSDILKRLDVRLLEVGYTLWCLFLAFRRYTVADKMLQCVMRFCEFITRSLGLKGKLFM